MTKRNDMDFFVLLDDDEQRDLLTFARSYMRVRELDKDKTLAVQTRLYFTNLEQKLADHLKARVV